MANLTVTAMVMATVMATAMVTLKMNKEKNGGNFGSWLQNVLYCTLEEFV